ncbi:MAG: hypothetical protein R3B82_03470 [Sandaracinaceae bacterium]
MCADPARELARARRQALEAGLSYVYTGNVRATQPRGTGDALRGLRLP